MILRIEHRLRYQYSRPVFLEPFTLRMRPRSDCTQTLLHHSLEIDPAPRGRAEVVDLDGNSVATAWFEGTHPALSLRAFSEVRTLRTHPFDFLITDEAFLRVPVPGHKTPPAPLAPYLLRENADPAVETFARARAEEVDGETLRFLLHLAERMQVEFEREHRAEGPARPPSRVLADRRGACRDLTVLYLDACRALGLPARFTTGYWFPEGGEEPPELHAWAEVYLPGGGWRGFDPSAGLAVADQYVALASGPDPDSAALTTGTFRGTGVQSQLTWDLDLEVLESAGSSGDLSGSGTPGSGL